MLPSLLIALGIVLLWTSLALAEKPITGDAYTCGGATPPLSETSVDASGALIPDLLSHIPYDHDH